MLSKSAIQIEMRMQASSTLYATRSSDAQDMHSSAKYPALMRGQQDHSPGMVRPAQSYYNQDGILQGGINAGVVILQPCRQTLQDMLSSLSTPRVTFLYIFRHFADTTQQLTTQVLLRHCGKRGGKICPTTLDFANQDVQVLNDRHRHLFVDRNNSIFFVHGCGHASLHGGP